jgi:TrmH family RNA methyltransferase
VGEEFVDNRSKDVHRAEKPVAIGKRTGLRIGHDNLRADRLRQLSLPRQSKSRRRTRFVGHGRVRVREGMENLRVVLVDTRNPLNMGAVARAMSNFGSLHLRVVNPYEKAYRQAVSAVGASTVMREAEEFALVAEAVADCTLVVGTTAVGNREVQQPLMGLQEAARMIRERLETSRVALLFGSEKRGLSNEQLSYCQWLLRIPTREEHRSMNLGQAAAVCLYEISRIENGKLKMGEKAHGGMRSSKGKIGKSGDEAGKEFASMETVERITEVWLEALERSGYVGARARRTSEEKLRRMLRRFTMTERDAEVVLGMMKKVVGKLEKG